MPKDIWIKRLGTHRGAPRVYLDAAQAARAGFAPGERFEVEVEGSRVVITRDQDGSRSVSARQRGDQVLPVIDINSKELLASFEGMSAVRVVVDEGRVILMPLVSEIKRRERVERLWRKTIRDEALAVGSLSHGGGVLSHAIHQGLADAGVKAELALVNEIRDDLIEQAMRANDAWLPSTRAAVVPMQELAQDDWLLESLPKLEILEMGLPCSGASKAGVTKRALDKMEDHPDVGHLVYSALVILSKTQPVLVLLENVPDYANSASASILRSQLRDMGYVCHEAILEGRDFGALENRVRWCMVAATQGVEFDFDRLAPTVRVVRRLGDVLDDVPVDDPAWRTYSGLKDKQDRDRSAGKGFKMQIMSPEDSSTPTLRKGYHKAGSTDPLLSHPTDPSKLRLLNAAEHARVKGVPEHLIEGMSQTMAHQLLGQGIVYAPFRALGKRIGERLSQAALEVDARMRRPWREQNMDNPMAADQSLTSALGQDNEEGDRFARMRRTG